MLIPRWWRTKENHVAREEDRISTRLPRSAGMVMDGWMDGWMDGCMYEWMLITIGREHMYMYEDGSCVPLDSCFPC